jgi:holo-[acyl-carrier protein] synthase
MIEGIGIDIIEVTRIAEKLGKDSGFREKVFSQAEIGYCESRSDKYQHYAVRFAAKEAFLKAIGKGLSAGHELSGIEVSVDQSGKPDIQLSADFSHYSTNSRIHVSLSHLKDVACAVVVIERVKS